MNEVSLYDGTITLVHADSREHMLTLPDQSIDCILTDPPYNLAQYSTGNIDMSWRTPFNNDIAEWDRENFYPAQWVEQFQRILKPTGTIFMFCSYNLLGDYHQVFNPVFDTFQLFVWKKTNPPPKLYRAGFLNSVELVACCWNKGHTWNFGKQSEMHNHFECGICQGKERLDCKTQKPVKLLKHLLKLATNERDLIYDPFMGVGSTCAASLEMNRRCTGVEIREHDYAQAVIRLRNQERKSHVSTIRE